jgi:transposase
MALDEYIAYDIYHGGYNTKHFNQFIRTKVLAKINSFPGPLSVLIINNTSYHRSQELKEICNKVGVVLKFLSPYSPNFNPIKELFSALKAWVRRNQELVKGFKDFGDFLKLTVKEFIEGKTAYNYFRLAGIEINKDNKVVKTDA